MGNYFCLKCAWSNRLAEVENVKMVRVYPQVQSFYERQSQAKSEKEAQSLSINITLEALDMLRTDLEEPPSFWDIRNPFVTL